jgi:hypothetical protein
MGFKNQHVALFVTGVARFLYRVVTLLNKATLLITIVQVTNSGKFIALLLLEHYKTNALLGK